MRLIMNDEYYLCPSGTLIRKDCIEVISIIQRIDPTPENELKDFIFEFIVRTKSGFNVGFNDTTIDACERQRNDILEKCKIETTLP